MQGIHVAMEKASEALEKRSGHPKQSSVKPSKPGCVAAHTGSAKFTGFETVISQNLI